MATGQCTSDTPPIRLPLIGRCGDRRVVRGWCLVTESDFHAETADRDWNLSSRGYAMRSEPGTTSRGAELLHRVIYERHCGPIPSGLEIDHIDRNRLNNIPGNLRAVSRSQNRVNVRRRSDNTSGFVGVSWNARASRWVAKIEVQGRGMFLGQYGTSREAADAVNHAYSQHFPHVPPPNP